MNRNKYLDDLKNLKPLPLEKIQRSGIKDQNSVKELKPVQSTIKNHKSKMEVSTMERLNNSKTLWGFGIAIFIYILQNILIALNIAGPDNLIMKTAVEAVIAIAGFFGVYGIRDALRKMQL